MIAEQARKIKAWVAGSKADILVGIVIVLISIISFGLGRLSISWAPRPPMSILGPDGSAANPSSAGIPKASGGKPQTASISAPTGSQDGGFVASKSGSAYHLPECPGAKQIKNENKIYFKTKEDAEHAGYHPAGNCPGLSN